MNCPSSGQPSNTLKPRGHCGPPTHLRGHRARYVTGPGWSSSPRGRVAAYIEADYIKTAQIGAIGEIIHAVTERTRRELGTWPSPETVVNRLVEALLPAADAEEEPERKGKLRVGAEALLGFGATSPSRCSLSRSADDAHKPDSLRLWLESRRFVQEVTASRTVPSAISVQVPPTLPTAGIGFFAQSLGAVLGQLT